MQWQNDSEIVAGLILQDRYPANAVNHRHFLAPYDKAIKMKQEGAPIEDIIALVQSYPIQTAFSAANSLNGLGEKADWGEILFKSYVAYQTAKKFEKYADNLYSGKDIDWADVYNIARKSQETEDLGFSLLSEITEEYVPFTPSGWSILDEHLGGIPSIGLITVGGRYGTLKTTFAIQLVDFFLEHHKDKIGAFFTLEMIKGEFAMRMKELCNPSDDVAKRVHVYDIPEGIDRLVAKAATLENLGIVVIDYADKAIRGEVTDGSMGHIYNTLSSATKQFGCPIVLIAHTNRTHQHEGGPPYPHFLRYTGIAENASWMILMPYIPGIEFGASKYDHIFPSNIKGNDVGYWLIWKCKGGFRKKKHDETPGAIQLPYRGDYGWSHNKGRWICIKELI